MFLCSLMNMITYNGRKPEITITSEDFIDSFPAMELKKPVDKNFGQSKKIVKPPRIDKNFKEEFSKMVYDIPTETIIRKMEKNQNDDDGNSFLLGQGWA